MADGGWGVRRRLAIWESRADSFHDKSSADPVRTSTSGSGAPCGAPAQYGASPAVGSTAAANGGRRWEQWDRTYDNVHFSTPRDGQFGGPGASSSYVPEDPRYTPTTNPPAPVAPKHNPLSLWGFQVNSANLKLVLKPNITDRKWKVIFEPQRGDIRFLTRKIPIMGLLNLQVGIGHDFRHNATGWKWKLTSVLNGNTPSEIRYKHNLPVCPGMDVRVGWNAEYVLPDMHGALGTGEPILGLNVGRLYASVERLEAIFTSID
ncbi:unnamed protein product [Closterium sp. Yama58-4]|nr:unnamed protein product [Closterium sp. Yama58-4]